MNIASAMPQHLSDGQINAINRMLENLEFLPISCLFCRGDEHRVVSWNRIIPDDFIYLPTKGALNCMVEGDERVIEPGEFMMVPAGARHGVTMTEGIDDYAVYALHMHLYDESRYRFLGTLDSPFGAVSDLDAWKVRLAACTCLMGRSPDAGAEYMEQLVTALLIEQVLGGMHLRDLPVEMDARISGIAGAVRRSPSKDWTVKRMAADCHLSVSRFRQLFVASTSTSPKKYVQRVRLSLARSLLVTKPGLTVEQVADRVGISDAHYFHAIYKQQFGETPKCRSPYRSTSSSE